MSQCIADITSLSSFDATERSNSRRRRASYGHIMFYRWYHCVIDIVVSHSISSIHQETFGNVDNTEMQQTGQRWTCLCDRKLITMSLLTWTSEPYEMW